MTGVTLRDAIGDVRAALQPASARALTACANLAAVHARHNLEVNASVQTGALRDSVAVRDGGRAAAIGSDLPYAASVESKKPFLRPAVAGHVNEYKQIVESELKNANGNHP